MSEYRFNFTTLMVEAMLSQKKWQTRRVVDATNSMIDGARRQADTWKKLGIDHDTFHVRDPRLPLITCACRNASLHAITPVLEVGDIIWVGEAHMKMADGSIRYKADEPSLKNRRPWTQPHYLKRDQCRIELQVESIVAQRLMDISEADAHYEGVLRSPHTGKYYDYKERCYLHHNAKDSYATLLTLIHKRDIMKENPYVWGYRFTYVKHPSNAAQRTS